MINFTICFHTEIKVFFQTKFHIGKKFYSFHSGMKFTYNLHVSTSGVPGSELRGVQNFWKKA